VHDQRRLLEAERMTNSQTSLDAVDGAAGNHGLIAAAVAGSRRPWCRAAGAPMNIR
jgi:hypothetical protein